jgi:hypothetical protein
MEHIATLFCPSSQLTWRCCCRQPLCSLILDISWCWFYILLHISPLGLSFCCCLLQT